jgi:hypothetical protein
MEVDVKARLALNSHLHISTFNFFTGTPHMSARPRPRPRPVQKPAATATSSSPGKTDTGDGSKSLDDDERFVRNRGRTDQAWANLLKEKGASHQREYHIHKG